MATWNTKTKSPSTFANQAKGDSLLTWNEATFTWDDAQGTWDDPYSYVTKQKSPSTFANQAKH